MKISEIKEKEAWNNYVASNSTDGGLLQSWDWGEFQQSYGRTVWRLGIENNGRIAVGWQAIEMPLRLGFSYLYVPRPSKPISNEFVNEIIEFAKNHKIAFIRVDQASDLELFKYDFNPMNFSIQPQGELILDISRPEDGLLGQMKQKTRYNIKVAEKHGVKIVNDNSKINDFLTLIQKTSDRQDIVPHPTAYYERMIKILGEAKIGELFFAEYKGKLISAALVTFFNNMAVYLHGGSDNEYKKVMAPYLLHWGIIKEAKDRGVRYYNLGGVSLDKPSWAGITRFKAGFAPETSFSKYAGVCDLPINTFVYGIYKLAKKIR